MIVDAYGTNEHRDVYGTHIESRNESLLDSECEMDVYGTLQKIANIGHGVPSSSITLF